MPNATRRNVMGSLHWCTVMRRPRARRQHGLSSLLAVFAAVLPAQQDTVIVCQKGDKLEVRMRCRAAATAAERDWLQLELDNKTKAPLELVGFTWRIDQAKIQNLQGKWLSRWSELGKGTDQDVFPRPPWIPLVLPPGITRIATPISDHATALLGAADAECRVTPRVVVHASLANEKVVANEQGQEFTFRWLPPDADGVQRMRATLHQLLHVERPAIGSLYLVSMLLKRSDIGGATPLTNRLAQFQPAPPSTAFASWAAVLSQLDRDFAADAMLLDWVLMRLRSEDETILTDLQQMRHVWRQDFLTEMLRRCREPKREHAPQISATVLGLMEQRGAPHRDDATACATLAAHWVAELGSTTPAELEAMSREDARLPRCRVNDALRCLGMARDRSHLHRIVPWLECRMRIWDEMHGRAATLPPDPVRLCDTACEAVLRLLGEDLEADYRRHMGDGNARRSETETRDAQITALQERLRTRR